MVAVELAAVLSDSGGRSGICLRTLAAVAAALACSSAVVLRDLLIGVRIVRIRENATEAATGAEAAAAAAAEVIKIEMGIYKGIEHHRWI